MNRLTTSPILDSIRRLIGDQHVNELPDQELLCRFRTEHDEAAFHGLLSRHGPMVLDVCRNVLRNEADAEDAFQATFLILAQKAAAIQKEAAVGSWLYGVAFRVALKARADGGRRHKHEAQAPVRIRSDETDDLSWRDVQQTLYAELNRFPERYRAPLVLCYLEGQTQDAAATLLRVSRPALKKRLERARALLRQRLIRRGLGSAAVLAASAWPMASAPASPPAKLLASTANAAFKGAAGELVPARVLALKAAAVKALFTGKLTTTRFLVVLVGLAATACGALLYHASIPEQPVAAPAAAAAQAPPRDQPGDPLPAGVVARLGTARLRPGGSIYHLAFAPDGKRLASWQNEMHVTDSLTIWDAEGRQLRRVDLPGVTVAYWQWLADGRGIAVLLVDHKPYVWELSDETAKPPASQVGPGAVLIRGGPEQEGYSCFAVSPDGKRLVGGTSNDQAVIHVWDLATNKMLSALPRPQVLVKQPEKCSALFFTPDGRRLIVFSPTKTDRGQTKEYQLIVRDTATGEEQRRFTSRAPLTQGTRMSVAVSDRWLALGMEDESGTVSLRDLSTGQPRTLTTKHGTRANYGFGISAIVFTRDGHTLLTAGRGGEIKVWDATTLQPIHTIPNASRSWIETMAVTADGRTVASGGQDNLIRLWDLATGKERSPADGLTGEVSGVGFSVDGKVALTFCADNTLRVWDAATGRPLRTTPLSHGGQGWPRGELAPDGHTLVTNAGGRVKALNLETGQEVPLPGLPRELLCDTLRFGADGKTLVALSENRVTLLDWPTVKVRRTITLLPPKNQPGVTRGDAADISPDGRWLITLAHREWGREERGMHFGFEADGVLDLWNAVTGEYIRQLLAGQGVGRTVQYTASGDVVVDAQGSLQGVGGERTELQSNLNLIDPLTGRLKRAFATPPKGPPGSGFRYILATALSADGRQLFVGSNDGSVVAYETLTGQMRQRLEGYHGLIMDLAGSKDGRRLIAGGSGLYALEWDISLAGTAPASPAPPPAEQAKLWDQLAAIKPEVSLPAMRRLAAHPEAAVALLRGVLKPAPSGPDDGLLDRLVADLGARKFKVRDQASRQLDQLGETAVPGVKARLAKVSDAEVQTRLMRFLARHDSLTPTPELVREARSLEILEQIDTAPALALLKELAGGGANMPRTRTAAEALRRLQR
jgi:RNA polymerase sigma factor (sigma-70 family)